jgi:hypothetical protein
LAVRYLIIPKKINQRGILRGWITGDTRQFGQTPPTDRVDCSDRVGPSDQVGYEWIRVEFRVYGRVAMDRLGGRRSPK